MFKEQRISAIQRELQNKGLVSIEQLAQKLGASRSTVCRDVLEMEERNLLRRVRGGVMENTQSPIYKEPSFDVRSSLHMEEKQRIALAALALIQPNDSLFFSRGTTVLELAKLMGDTPGLHIATNDLMCAMELTRMSNVYLMLLGGTIHPNAYATTGFFAENMLAQAYADKAFIGMDAVDFSMGFMDYSAEEIQTKKLMIQKAEQTIVLCDHSKFETKAFINICPFQDADILITGREANLSVLERLEETGIQIITA